jgi:hypothetical protein
MVWLWAGAPIGSEGGSGSLQDSAEYTNRSRQPLVNNQKKVADDSQNVWHRLPAKPGSITSLAPDGGQQGIVRRTLDIDGPVRGCLDVPAVPGPKVRTNFALDRQWRG